MFATYINCPLAVIHRGVHSTNVSNILYSMTVWWGPWHSIHGIGLQVTLCILVCFTNPFHAVL